MITFLKASHWLFNAERTGATWKEEDKIGSYCVDSPVGDLNQGGGREK